MGKMNVLETLSLIHYGWSMVQFFFFSNWSYLIPVLIHLLIAALLFVDWINTQDAGMQTNKNCACLMKTEASTQTDISQNPFLSQSNICTNPFLNMLSVSGKENITAYSDKNSESTIDEAMVMWKPYAISNINSNMTNPFVNPFYDLLNIEDPLEHLDQGSDDGEIACSKWVIKHQELFNTETVFEL